MNTADNTSVAGASARGFEQSKQNMYIYVGQNYCVCARSCAFGEVQRYYIMRRDLIMNYAKAASPRSRRQDGSSVFTRVRRAALDGDTRASRVIFLSFSAERRKINGVSINNGWLAKENKQLRRGRLIIARARN